MLKFLFLFVVLNDERPSAPLAFNISEKSSTSLTAVWRPPQVIEDSCPLISEKSSTSLTAVWRPPQVLEDSSPLISEKSSISLTAV